MEYKKHEPVMPNIQADMQNGMCIDSHSLSQESGKEVVKVADRLFYDPGTGLVLYGARFVTRLLGNL